MDKKFKSISIERQEEFEKFLFDRMSVEKKAAFQKELTDDLDLKTQFETFKTLLQTIEEESLRNSLEEFHTQFDNWQTIKKPFFVKYRIAATIALLVSLGVWFFNRQTANERLFETHFSPDPGLPTVMGSSDNYVFYEAMVDYKQGNLEIAKKKWEKLVRNKPSNDTLNYYIGVTNLAQGTTHSAIAYLRKVLDTNSVFEQEAWFYLGMAYLKKDELEPAKRCFENSSLAEAKEILAEID